MKKVLFVAFMVMAFVALGSLAIFAGGKECTADKATDAKAASATTTKACCASKAGATSASATKADATLASSKTTSTGAECTPAEKAACAARALKTGVACTPAEMAACLAKTSATSTAAHKESCSPATIGNCVKEANAKHAEICGAEAANHRLTSMSIKGMTCAGCESSVKTALMAVEGVHNVIEVCSKAGFAVVCTAKDSKLSNESMIKAVSAKGFESEIIPAVSVTTTNEADKAAVKIEKKDGAK